MPRPRRNSSNPSSRSSRSARSTVFVLTSPERSRRARRPRGPNRGGAPTRSAQTALVRLRDHRRHRRRRGSLSRLGCDARPLGGRHILRGRGKIEPRRASELEDHFHERPRRQPRRPSRRHRDVRDEPGWERRAEADGQRVARGRPAACFLVARRAEDRLCQRARQLRDLRHERRRERAAGWHFTRDPAVVAPAWSPDGRKIAFTGTTSSAQFDIYVVNADRSGLRNLTQRPGDDVFPAWSPGQKK